MTVETSGADGWAERQAMAPVHIFKEAMRRHAAGVCIITIGEGEAVNGMAATAVTSFSMDPPALLVCVNTEASIAQALKPGARFGVTVLGRRHEDVVSIFSKKPSGRARFADDRWRFETQECPWLEDAVANLVCEVKVTVTYATHQAVVGAVLGGRIGPDSPSLVYRDGCFL